MLIRVTLWPIVTWILGLVVAGLAWGCAGASPTAPTASAASVVPIASSGSSAGTSAAASANSATASSIAWSCLVGGCADHRAPVYGGNGMGALDVPAAPRNLTVTITGSTVTLSWQGSLDAVSYIIDAGSAPGVTNIISFDLNSAVTTITVNGVPNGTYYVRARARNADGSSAPSNEITAAVGTATPPPPPGTAPYIGLWKVLRAGANSEVDVSMTDQTFDIRTDGTIIYRINVPPIVCQQTFSYTATGTTSGTWTSTVLTNNCPYTRDFIGMRRHGTFTLPDANALYWFYEGADNPGDEPNHIIMTRLR